MEENMELPGGEQGDVGEAEAGKDFPCLEVAKASGHLAIWPLLPPASSLAW